MAQNEKSNEAAKAAAAECCGMTPSQADACCGTSAPGASRKAEACCGMTATQATACCGTTTTTTTED